MDLAVRSLYAAASAAPGRRWVVAAAGGGASLLGHLARVPGGSSHLLEATVPYSREAFHKYAAPVAPHVSGKYSDAAAAVLLAQAALQRAKALTLLSTAGGWSSVPAPATASCRGVGLASALRTLPERRGGDEVHCAVAGDGGVSVGSISFVRGAWERGAQEDAAALLALQMLWSDATGADPALPSPFMTAELAAAAGAGGSATVTWGAWAAPDAIAALVRTAASPPGATAPPRDWLPVTHVVYPPGRSGGSASANAPIGRALLLPGSFNPLHHGHLRCAAAAVAKAAAVEGGAERAVVFELSATNVDKPPLDPAVVAARVTQFVDHAVVVTRAPRFIEKAALFPGAWFVVGYDTAARLVQPRYYASADDMVQALLRVAATGTRFIVAGRLDAAATPPRFSTLADLAPAIPPALHSAGLFVGLSEAEFRDDVSSTELRAAAAAPGAGGT